MCFCIHKSTPFSEGRDQTFNVCTSKVTVKKLTNIDHQMDRDDTVPAHRCSACIPMLRRTRTESGIRDQYSSSEEHDLYIQYAGDR